MIKNFILRQQKNLVYINTKNKFTVCCHEDRDDSKWHLEDLQDNNWIFALPILLIRPIVMFAFFRKIGSNAGIENVSEF